MRSRQPRVLLTTLSIISMLAAAASAQTEGDPKPIAIAPEAVVDVGAVAQGEKIRHSFALHNEGDAALRVTEVKPNCGCTVADFDAKIAPAASGSIDVVVDTSDFKGPIAKSIQVFTNDADNPRLTLVVKANVKVLVDSSPSYMRFVTVFGEGDESRSASVWASGRENFKVTKVESPFSYLKVDFHAAGEGEGNSTGEGPQWVVEANLQAGAPPGPIADYIKVHTNLPKTKVFKIPVSGLVRPVLTVLPRIADFGRREVTEPHVASLEIKNLGTADVTLDEIVSDVAGLAAEIESVESGRLFKVVLTLDPSMAAGPFQGLVTITTSSEKQPVLEVSVRGVIL